MPSVLGKYKELEELQAATLEACQGIEEGES
jgi:hypothetical protein